MFKSMNMRSFATYFVFCWLMAIAFTAYPVHAEYTLVFPYVTTHRRPTAPCVPWGDKYSSVFMRIVNNQISTTVKNAIWNTDRIYYDLVNNESYFETGGGDLSWILSLSNPNNNISFNENQPITIKFYLGDGTLVDENTMWKDAESSNDSNHPLINTEADNGNIVWDDDESQFIVSLLSNNSCALPCWGGKQRSIQ